MSGRLYAENKGVSITKLLLPSADSDYYQANPLHILFRSLLEKQPFTWL